MYELSEPEDLKRPYELEGPNYALWYDIGKVAGFSAQATVGVALCDGSHKVSSSHLSQPEIVVVRMLAKRRGVLLHFA